MQVHVGVNDSQKLFAGMSVLRLVGPRHRMVLSRSFLLNRFVAVRMLSQARDKLSDTGLLEILDHIARRWTPRRIPVDQLLQCRRVVRRTIVNLRFG